MLAGWKVQKDTSLGDAKFTVTGKVKNLRGHTSTASIHFTFIDKSGEVLASVQCNSADLKSGHTQALNCIPDGKYGKYKTVPPKSPPERPLVLTLSAIAGNGAAIHTGRVIQSRMVD